MLQCIYLLHDCEVKPDIHVEIENSGIWLVQAQCLHLMNFADRNLIMQDFILYCLIVDCAGIQFIILCSWMVTIILDLSRVVQYTQI